jgi:hypothetical protein
MGRRSKSSKRRRLEAIAKEVITQPSEVIEKLKAILGS